MRRHPSPRLALCGAAALLASGLVAALARPLRAQPDRPAAAARAVVTGTVRDSATGAPLPGASVALVGTGRSALTDADGRFRFPDVARGARSLQVRRLSYAPRRLPIRVPDTGTVVVDVALAAQPFELSPVRTQAELTERDAFERLPSDAVVTLTGGAMATVPAVGEPDVLRTVQLLPGVVARHDFTAGLNVRGGEQDQNLVLLDGIPIYQPFHLGGVFGTFMDATVGDLRLLAGAFPAEYGGRLSSVLEVSSAPEARTGVHGETQTSLLAGSLSLSGASASGETSWRVAGRRTWADLVARSLADRPFPYWFTDAQAHLAQSLPRGGTLTLTGYIGRDVLSEDFTQREDTLRLDGAYELDWGNAAIGTTWSQPFGARTAVVTRASATRYTSSQNEGNGSFTAANDVREFRASSALRTERGAHVIGAGVEFARHEAEYDERSPQLTATLADVSQRTYAAAAFLDDTWTVGDWLLRPGVRLEHVSAASFTAVSPRLTVRRFFGDETALTLAAGRTTQWVHALREEDDALRLFDRWVLADSVVPVTTANQGSLGVERWLARDRFVRVDVFAKDYGRLVERNLEDDRGIEGDEFRDITGRSYGVDVYLRQLETRSLSGWIAYTYTWNERRAGDETWVPAQDRRHTLNAIAAWRPRGGTVYSARVGFGSGIPYTAVDAQLVRRIADPSGNVWDRTAAERDVQSVAAARNAERLPSYVRIDLSVQRTFVRGRATLTPVFGVVNATNRRNVFAYRFDYDAEPATRESISQLPIIPTLGLTVTW